MKKVIFALGLAAASMAALADESNASPAVKALIGRYMSYNEQCRGGSGDNPSTLKACQLRDKAYIAIKKSGWCWGPPEVSNVDKSWLKCADTMNSASGAHSEIAHVQPNSVKHAPAIAQEVATPSAVESSAMPYCSVKGSAYRMAAQYRDQAVSPQDAWAKDMSIDDQWHYVDAEERKAIINKVYFDPSLASMHGDDLARRVYTECMTQRRQTFQPLQ